MPASADTKEEPGYGEEPDTAAPPDSFEDFSGHYDNGQDQSVTPAHDIERPQSTAAARDEPLQMKEDG